MRAVRARRPDPRLGTALVLALALIAPASGSARDGQVREAALYPRDDRREMGGEDYRRFAGAGVLWCRRPDGVPQKAAAAWLVGVPDLVVLNAHNFRDRRLAVIRAVSDCYFQIGGRNYEFVAESLRLGTAPGAEALHITDDWALLRLASPVDGVAPQPVPDTPDLTPGPAAITVTMVSPGGHANFRGGTSLESCAIRFIDPPSEDAMRRVRHDCNDGYGGSGSGLFDESGRLLALQSASLSMNSRRPFDVEFHYGSAMLFEGELLAAIRAVAGGRRQH